MGGGGVEIHLILNLNQRLSNIETTLGLGPVSAYQRLFFPRSIRWWFQGPHISVGYRSNPYRSTHSSPCEWADLDRL